MSLFARSNPRSVVHWSVCRTFCCINAFTLLCALCAGFTVAVKTVRPVLLQIQHGSPALQELFSHVRPDLRVVLLQNATFSVNRALPYAVQLGGTLGGRAVLERPRVAWKEISRQLTRPAALNPPDWVLSGHKVAMRGALKVFSNDDEEDGDEDPTNIEIDQVYLGDMRIELAAAAFCEALSRSELDAALAREHELKALVHQGNEDARTELSSLAYYSTARMADAAAAAGTPDVVTHRLGALVRRLLQRHDSFAPLAEFLDGLIPPAASPADDSDVNDDEEEEALTASYVCTAASASAGVEALSRHPLLARARPEILLVSTYALSTLALVDIWDLLYYCVAVGTFAAFVVMRAAWAAGLAKGRPLLGHVFRIAAVTAVPVFTYFKLVQLWLPDAQSGGRSNGALSHPLALLASLRIDTLTAQVITHAVVTLLLCVHVYDDAPGQTAVFLVVAQQPAPPGPLPPQPPAPRVGPFAAVVEEPRRGAPVADAVPEPAAVPGRDLSGSSGGSSDDDDSSSDSDSEGDRDEVGRRLAAAMNRGGSDALGGDLAALFSAVLEAHPQLGGSRLEAATAGEAPALDWPPVAPAAAPSVACAMDHGAESSALGVVGGSASLAAEIALLSALADTTAQLAHYEALLAAHAEFMAGL